MPERAVPLFAGSVELGTIDVSASRKVSLELPQPAIERLELGWASVLPICEPCPPFDARCRGDRYRIERIWVVGVGHIEPDQLD